ncbi:uncharacterized protein [Ambystoma mexicanum]|uniref:uncharacterized protein n=1 Tax=Ambystoma mexicanum TaxID=8296 RepID=UPI0037E9C911
MKESIVFDICSSQEATIPPVKIGMIPTDLVLIPPSGCYMRFAPKSAMAWKFGTDVLAGVIDPDFWGDIKVLLQSHGEIPFEVQGILEKALFPHFKVSKTDETERGTLGFVEVDEPPTIEEKREEELII